MWSVGDENECRNSVSMTGTTTAGSFRTLQRSPIRRTSMAVTYPALSPQVLTEYPSLILCVYNGFIFKECLYLLDYHENVSAPGEVIVWFSGRNQRRRERDPVCIYSCVLNCVKVVEVIRSLEEHRKKAEEEGKLHGRTSCGPTPEWCEGIHCFLILSNANTRMYTSAEISYWI